MGRGGLVKLHAEQWKVEGRENIGSRKKRGTPTN